MLDSRSPRGFAQAASETEYGKAFYSPFRDRKPEMGCCTCIIHEFSRDPLLLLCNKVFWIFTLKTLFSEKALSCAESSNSCE